MTTTYDAESHPTQGMTVTELHAVLERAINEGRGGQVFAVEVMDDRVQWTGIERVGLPDGRDSMGLDDALAVPSAWLTYTELAWNGPGV